MICDGHACLFLSGCCLNNSNDLKFPQNHPGGSDRSNPSTADPQVFFRCTRSFLLHVDDRPVCYGPEQNRREIPGKKIQLQLTLPEDGFLRFEIQWVQRSLQNTRTLSALCV